MTARRALVAVAHTALGAAVLAAVVGVLWALGTAWLGPNAGHGLRLLAGVPLVVAAGAALCIAGTLIRAAHDIGRAIAVRPRQCPLCHGSGQWYVGASGDSGPCVECGGGHR